MSCTIVAATRVRSWSTSAAARSVDFVAVTHGWTYRLDGKLLGVPHLEGYEGTGFNKNDPQYNMQKLARYESYRGFVFATLDPDASDLKTWLGGAGDVHR